MSANQKQVGGTHYASTYQHWDYVLETGLPYLLAQVTRYVCRWKKKSGLEDVRKALHYIQKERERFNECRTKHIQLTAQFCEENKLGEHEQKVFRLVADYHTGQFEKLDQIEFTLKDMLAILEG